MLLMSAVTCYRVLPVLMRVTVMTLQTHNNKQSTTGEKSLLAYLLIWQTAHCHMVWHIWLVNWWSPCTGGLVVVVAAVAVAVTCCSCCHLFLIHNLFLSSLLGNLFLTLMPHVHLDRPNMVNKRMHTKDKVESPHCVCESISTDYSQAQSRSSQCEY